MIKSNIKTIMDKKGLAIKPFAEANSLSHLTVINARSDEKFLNCKVSTLARIAAALDCKVKDLFTED